MDSKRLVLTILLLAAGLSTLSAQQSAQATMKVQVTVVEGNSITPASNTNIDLTKSTSSAVSEITTMKINKRSNTAIILNRPDMLDLIDEKGGQLSIPLIYTDKVSDREVISRVVAKPIQKGDKAQGVYKGALTTSIAYL